MNVVVRREVDAWKVRWCGVCRQFEFDAGAPRGWVVLRGPPPAEYYGYRESEGI